MIQCVCSVPHSGTRTLVEYLGLEDNSPRGRWMHFGYEHDEPLIASGQYDLQIPLRHPMEVAASWARRGKNVGALIRAYQSMFAHLNNGVAHTIHKMEDIPRVDGTDDHDRDKINAQWVIDDYQGRVLLEVVHPHLELFEIYYG